MNPIELQVRGVPLPAESRVSGRYPKTDLADAFEIALPAGIRADAESLARCLFATQAPWARALLRVRDALVGGFGLKTSTQLARLPGGGIERVGFFRVYDRTDNEIVLGEDDAHLDFRVSVLARAAGRSGAEALDGARPGATGGRCVVLSTVVSCHNRFGRLYLLLIAPFHRLIVRSTLRRAARRGWPVG